MQRLTLAYLIIGLMLLSLAGLVGFKFYYSRTRVYDRRVRKERDDHAETMAKQTPNEVREPDKPD